MKCNITCIPGDGIGAENIAKAKKVLYNDRKKKSD